MAQEVQPGALTVEHILPRGGGDAWADVIANDPDIVEDGAERLGNLCLLTNVNSALGRKPFGEKKAVFLKSELETTREVAKWNRWTAMTIDHRQAAMAKHAVQAWRFQ